LNPSLATPLVLSLHHPLFSLFYLARMLLLSSINNVTLFFIFLSSLLLIFMPVYCVVYINLYLFKCTRWWWWWWRGTIKDVEMSERSIAKEQKRCRFFVIMLKQYAWERKCYYSTIIIIISFLYDHEKYQHTFSLSMNIHFFLSHCCYIIWKFFCCLCFLYPLSVFVFYSYNIFFAHCFYIIFKGYIQSMNGILTGKEGGWRKSSRGSKVIVYNVNINISIYVN